MSFFVEIFTVKKVKIELFYNLRTVECGVMTMMSNDDVITVIGGDESKEVILVCLFILFLFLFLFLIFLIFL